MSKLKLPAEVLEFFRKSGSRGGKGRAKKYSAEQLRAWGKLGGRPKESDRKSKTGK